MIRALVCAAVVWAGMFVGAEGVACLVDGGFGVFQLFPNPSDTSPPGPVSITSFEVSRGTSPEEELGGCDEGVYGCGSGRAYLTIYFDPANDDQTLSKNIGYVLELSDGALPDGFRLPTEPFTERNAGVFVLEWSDEASDNQDPFSFTIQLTAMDAAGNMGPTSEPFVISDAGTDAGCQIAPGQAGGSLVWALLLLFVWGWPRWSVPSRASRGFSSE